MDGHQQRKARIAAREALEALATGEAHRARTAAARAVELDQLGIYEAFRAAVQRAAGDVEADGIPRPSAWDAIAASLGPNPLAATARRLGS
ncbi:MAG: hypothetical protein ACE5KX_04985 [Acidimicrobiia bacterium]